MSERMDRVSCRLADEAIFEARFDWCVDRYVHRFFRARAGELELSLQPDHDLGDPAWPASPPLQQIHFETRGSGPIALGVGQAGTNHWSVSIEPQEPGWIYFDWACRYRTEPRYLGSVYRWNDGETDQVESDTKRLRILSGGIATSIEVIEGSLSLDRARKRVSIDSVDWRGRTSGTSRWSYRVTAGVSPK